VREPGPSRDHSERLLQAFGVAVESAAAGAGRVVRLSPPERLQTPGWLAVPGDISSAAFWLVAALLLPGSRVAVPGVGVNPTRTGLLDVLRSMGARLDEENHGEESGEPVADLVAAYNEGLTAAEVGGELVPRAIDEFPILAVAATQATGRTLVRDAAELRVKESDRISALAEELRRMGAIVEEQADGFAIEGPVRLQGARLDAHGDHRLAMALAVAGLLAAGETVVQGWECVADSYPGFEATLAQLAGDEVSG
jgi:3-phosphoshikimate 1-carboxyvinyltransferase